MRLKERFGDAVLETSSWRGDEVAVVERARVAEVLTFLKHDAELRFDLPVDLTVIDWLGKKDVRFEVVYVLYSLAHRHRVRIKCRVPEDDATVATSIEVYPGFRWAEREAWDMYGVRFAGNPDPRRLFMYESFQGHPLRKDYPKEGRQPLVRRDGA
jgi:NADH-quinone oxidoreductase subunit C